MFVTVEQCKQIISNFLGHSGRGGFMTGVVTAVAPLAIVAEDRLPITAADLYVTDSCIGLSVNLAHAHRYEDTDEAKPTTKTSESALQNGVVLRRALQVGDGVLLLCRPDNIDGVRYILLDRIQPYSTARAVSAI